MRDLFLTILELTFAAGCLVPLVLLLRLALGKAPKFIVCILWGMVALRLLLPVTLESAVSLNPGKETFAKLEKEFLIRGTPPVEDVPLQPNLPQETPDLPQASPEIPQATPTETAVDWVAILAWVWFAGVCAMGACGAISYLRLRRKVQVCLQVEKRVYLCDEIGTPFLLGLFRPCIYLPSSMEECHRASVLSHEQAHIRRGDHIWKPLGFVLLAIHWFNPLLWVAYFFLCRDIETACDEKVVRGMDDAHKASYSHALVACSLQGDSHRGWISACPIAFGEVGVKSRVKGVLSYKKPAFWVLVAAILACVAVAVFFLTDPLSAGQDENNSTPHTSQEADDPSMEDLLEMMVLFDDYVPSTEQLGEVYYYCGEFQSDLLLADVMPTLEKKGYTFTNYERFLEEGDDNLSYWAKNESLGANLILVECTTEEEAKEIFASAMESSAEYLYIIDQATSYTVTRMGRVVYGTLHSDAAFPDLMEVYGLPLPEKTPLYKGGSFTYYRTVDFDTAVEKAVALGYAPCRYNKMLDEVCADVQNLLTADGRGFLSIVKLSSLEEGLESEVIEDDRLLRWTYQEVAKVIFDCFGVVHGQESTKFVMISKDTFIAGSSYYVDQFIAQLEQ